MVTMRKIELYVLNLGDDISIGGMNQLISDSLQGTALNCYAHFGDINEKDIGEWTDDHKFNSMYTSIEEYRKEFENES